MGLEDHAGIGIAHVGPAFHRLKVLIGDGAHDGADVEGLLAARVGDVVEHLADRFEFWSVVGCSPDVALAIVSSFGATREALSRRPVGMLVVLTHDLAGRFEVGCPVLRLAVGTHDAVVAAEAEVVFGRDAAREVERLLAGEHHRAVGGHDQDPFGVHQHGRLGVPVGLTTDGDAGDDDVDLATSLGEFNQLAQHNRDPVHVFGAAGHGDAGASRHRVPLEGGVVFFRQLQRPDGHPAFRFGEGCQLLGRVPEQHHPGDPFRVAFRGGRQQAADEAAVVIPLRPVDWLEGALIGHGVFGEVATVFGQAVDQLVRVDRTALLRHDDILPVAVEDRDRLIYRLDNFQRIGIAGVEAEAQNHVTGCAVFDQRADHFDPLEPERGRQRGELFGASVQSFDRQAEWRPEVEYDSVHRQSSTRIVFCLGGTDCVGAGGKEPFHDWHADDLPRFVPARCQVANLGDCGQAHVARIVNADQLVAIDSGLRFEAFAGKIPEAEKFGTSGNHRVAIAEGQVFGKGSLSRAIGVVEHPALGGGPGEGHPADVVRRLDSGDDLVCPALNLVR